jgi:hypothetical protein
LEDNLDSSPFRLRMTVMAQSGNEESKQYYT